MQQGPQLETYLFGFGIWWALGIELSSLAFRITGWGAIGTNFVRVGRRREIEIFQRNFIFIHGRYEGLLEFFCLKKSDFLVLPGLQTFKRKAPLEISQS